MSYMLPGHFGRSILLQGRVRHAQLKSICPPRLPLIQSRIRHIALSNDGPAAGDDSKPTPSASSPEGSSSDIPPSEAPASAAVASSATADAGPENPDKEPATLYAAVGAFFLSMWISVKQFPAWVQRRQLNKLKTESDEEPTNAEKHAAYLTALNQSGNHAEVMSRVESRECAAGAPVTVEYMRALVFSGRLSDFSAASAVLDANEDHRSLTQLLRDLQNQTTEEKTDEAPGNSHRRPLHIALRGMPITGAAPQPKAGVWQIFWTLLQTASLVLSLAFLWLVGTYALQRRFQAAPIGAPTTTTTTTASTSSSSAASPSMSSDPKEYKKDELPEKSERLFKDVKGCDEAKEELKEVVEFLKDPLKFTRLGAKLPKGVLLTGPPGTGKTLLAKAVAGEAGVPFFYRAGSEFEELYVGVGSRRMRALFQAAKKKSTPCIVFIEILDYYLSDKPTEAGLDKELIARNTAGFSGADLSNLVNEAAIMAAKLSADLITGRMIDDAYDKIHMGLERKSAKRNPESLKRTAYHEAGHALVAMMTPGANQIHKATIIQRGSALGMVSQAGREDEFAINYQQMLAHIRICMGGTVAEEIIFGKNEVSSGATDDLRQATNMARHIVMQCGMSEAIGPIYVSDTTEKVLSEDFKQKDLHNLANALLDRETLTKADIEDVLNIHRSPPPPGVSGGSGGESRRKEDEVEAELEGEVAPAQAQEALSSPAAEKEAKTDKLQIEPVVPSLLHDDDTGTKD
eukprot:gene22115-29174_t